MRKSESSWGGLCVCVWLERREGGGWGCGGALTASIYVTLCRTAHSIPLVAGCKTVPGSGCRAFMETNTSPPAVWLMGHCNHTHAYTHTEKQQKHDLSD